MHVNKPLISAGRGSGASVGNNAGACGYLPDAERNAAAFIDEFNMVLNIGTPRDRIITSQVIMAPARRHHGAGRCHSGRDGSVPVAESPAMTSAIVTSTYRYKRPPRKWKPVASHGIRITKQ
jgi:hypothetical protein